MRKKKKKKYVRTTVSLPENVWKELRIESFTWNSLKVILLKG